MTASVFNETWQIRRNVVRKSFKVTPKAQLLTTSTAVSVKTHEALVCVEGEIRKQTDEVNKCARSRARIWVDRSAVVNTEHA